MPGQGRSRGSPLATLDRGTTLSAPPLLTRRAAFPRIGVIRRKRLPYPVAALQHLARRDPLRENASWPTPPSRSSSLTRTAPAPRSIEAGLREAGHASVTLVLHGRHRPAHRARPTSSSSAGEPQPRHAGRYVPALARGAAACGDVRGPLGQRLHRRGGRGGRLGLRRGRPPARADQAHPRHGREPLQRLRPPLPRASGGPRRAGGSARSWTAPSASS